MKKKPLTSYACLRLFRLIGVYNETDMYMHTLLLYVPLYVCCYSDAVKYVQLSSGYRIASALKGYSRYALLDRLANRINRRQHELRKQSL